MMTEYDVHKMLQEQQDKEQVKSLDFDASTGVLTYRFKNGKIISMKKNWRNKWREI
jgi:hypothetical protein|tara:strand:+ start:415 stop:582 length:168 start_codon:yes stop_codon:yes gene_type:complete